MAGVFLEVVRRGRTQIIIKLDPGPLSLGRDQENDIALPDPTLPELAGLLTVTEEGRVFVREQSPGALDWDGRGQDVEGELNLESRLRAGSFELRIRHSGEATRESDRPVRKTQARRADEPTETPARVIEHPGGAIELDPSHTLSIGGQPTNDVVIQDPFVSGYHCRVQYDRDRWLLIDLDSTNGTFLNGVRIEVVELPKEGVISVGDVELRVTTPLPRLAVKEEANVQEFFGMKAASPVMHALFPRIERFARAGDPVLVHGESGVGKELVARALHMASERALGPFRVLNCATLSAQLSGAELFGHRKGAFTGAAQAQSGMFEEASGGTLFLDEIGELPLEVQSTLLRTLEVGTIRRIGTSTETPVDVRIIAATHRKLHERVANGFFREDLMYRVNVLTLNIPPLRERPEDIELLARHFLDGAPGVQIASEAVARLRQHSWPGNVRELRNVIRCALAMREDDVIRGSDLQIMSTKLDAVQRSPRRRAALNDEAVRRETIEALEASGWVASHAAARLGLTKGAMSYRMDRYGLKKKT